jgi:cystathionine gamma-lyase
VIPLINLTSTYKLAEAYNPCAYQYSRFGNPTRNALETCLAALDTAKYAITFASGLGAQTAVISSLKKGNGIIVDQDVNVESIRLFKNFAVNMDMDVQVTDLNDLENVKKLLSENVKLVWFETPASTTMKIVNIRTASDFIHEHCQARIVVDNTTLSPYFQRPLEFGADIVIYSITKYMHGHSDVVMGSLVMNDDTIYQKLKYHQGAIGIIPSPFDW